MNILTIVIYIFTGAYIIRTVRNILYMVFLWQLKEYRPDRMKSYLITPIGKRLYKNPVSLIKTSLLLAIIVSVFLLIKDSLSQARNIYLFVIGLSILLFWLVWIFEALRYLKELFSTGWHVPKFTARTFFILIPVLLILIPIIIHRYIDLSLLITAVILDRLLNPLIILAVFTSDVPSIAYKKMVIYLAKRKISKMKKLHVIGITGSYGKTSTKEFLYQILKTRFSVVKTVGSTNTEIGVALTVLQKLDPRTEVFIAEMGAYKKGEIGAICKIIRPDTGIITGLNQQHLELFGSQQKILDAKFELIEYLKKNGRAYYNYSNHLVRSLVERTLDLRPDLKIGLFTGKPSDIIYNKFPAGTSCLSVNEIQVRPDELKFNIYFKGEKIKCGTKLAGEQNIENIAMASLVAFGMGFTNRDIKKNIDNLKPPDKTMKIFKNRQGCFLIDDTFNANPDGVKAALDYMKLFQGKKILLFTPLIELGDESLQIHRKLGGLAGSVCDLIYFTNPNYYKDFQAGIDGKGKTENKVRLLNQDTLEKLINLNQGNDCVIVFEGKEAGKYLPYFKNK